MFNPDSIPSLTDAGLHNATLDARTNLQRATGEWAHQLAERVSLLEAEARTRNALNLMPAFIGEGVGLLYAQRGYRQWTIAQFVRVTGNVVELDSAPVLPSKEEAREVISRWYASHFCAQCSTPTNAVYHGATWCPRQYEAAQGLAMEAQDDPPCPSCGMGAPDHYSDCPTRENPRQALADLVEEQYARGARWLV